MYTDSVKLIIIPLTTEFFSQQYTFMYIQHVTLS